MFKAIEQTKIAVSFITRQMLQHCGGARAFVN